MEGVLTIILIFGTPVLLGIVIAVAVVANSRHTRLQQDKARTTYERIVLEKLDVIKNAVAMGYSQNELAALDARLEKLVGREKLHELLTNPTQTPQASPALHAVDLDSETQAVDSIRKAAE